MSNGSRLRGPNGSPLCELKNWLFGHGFELRHSSQYSVASVTDSASAYFLPGCNRFGDLKVKRTHSVVVLETLDLGRRAVASVVSWGTPVAGSTVFSRNSKCPGRVELKLRIRTAAAVSRPPFGSVKVTAKREVAWASAPLVSPAGQDAFGFGGQAAFLRMHRLPHRFIPPGQTQRPRRQI